MGDRRWPQPRENHVRAGSLTFTSTLAAGIVHLLGSEAVPGTFNLTNDGPVRSWAQLAAAVVEASGLAPSDVRPVSTAEYGEGKQLAPRPQRSALSLAKIKTTGFVAPDADSEMDDYLRRMAG